MTMLFDQIEKALQAPTMDAVIALTERFQDLEIKPEAMVFTFLRRIDETILIGYSEAFSSTRKDIQQRDFVLVEARRGTRREERLLLMTLQEIGLKPTYNSHCFAADSSLIRHLNHLGWPIGDLKSLTFRKKRHNQRFSHQPDDH
ncbi:hypothetical protein KR100_09260 [Synechococcus sp. KORDI-100]|nr:hypothetical protein KR100_09260 [Synechococcus sp. KORDI-100]